MLRLGGFIRLRHRVLIALPLAAVLTFSTTAAYAGLACRITSPRITESSGLALSFKHPGYAYTLNDDEEGNAAIVYTIKLSTGAAVGTTILAGVEALDPEAIAIEKKTGKIWFADTGNDGGRTDKDIFGNYPTWAAHPPTLYSFTEPSTVSGRRTVSATAYPLEYPKDKDNVEKHWDVETLLINPKNSTKHLVTKAGGMGHRLALPSTLKANQPNLVQVREDLTDNVSDGSYTPDGKWALIRSGKKIYVLNPTYPWKIHSSATPDVKLKQPESLSFQPDGKKFLIGSEGADSPLYRVLFDTKKGKIGKV